MLFRSPRPDVERQRDKHRARHDRIDTERSHERRDLGRGERGGEHAQSDRQQAFGAEQPFTALDGRVHRVAQAVDADQFERPGHERPGHDEVHDHHAGDLRHDEHHHRDGRSNDALAEQRQPVERERRAHTALRETFEEIGLHARHVEVIGQLSAYVTRAGYRVTPVVGVVQPPFELQPNADEVAEIFEVPLWYLLNKNNHLLHPTQLDGRLRHYYAVQYERYYIRGVTAGLLVNLHRHVTAP